MIKIKIKNCINKIIIFTLSIFICLTVININNIFAANDVSSDLEIYFYQLGKEVDETHKLDNYHTGDSFIIKSGNCEILVDGGSTLRSADIIKNKMMEVCTDKIWEYIIVTHADSDHISCFPNAVSALGIFSIFKEDPKIDNPLEKDKLVLETIIDFDITNDDTVKIDLKNKYFDSLLYVDYANARDKLVKGGTLYYTASQCTYEKRNLTKDDIVNGAKPYQLDNSNWQNNLSDVFKNPRDSKSNFELKILYNYFYDHKFKPENTSIQPVDKNNVSVCFLITMNKNKFLFTGDLMEYESKPTSKPSEGEDYSSQVYGETKLLEYNSKELKDGVDFFKAGHHGSRTSNSKQFVDVIRPKYVVMTTVAGSYQYSKVPADAFPANVVMNRFFKYTDYIYIPSYAVNTLVDAKKNKWSIDAYSYYGDITVTLKGEEISIDTQYLKGTLIQYTDYFINNRSDSLYVYTFDSNSNAMASCTLIKYGHIEILIDCGNEDLLNRGYIDKIKQYCRDGILEYVILTHNQQSTMSQVVSKITDKESYSYKSVFNSFKIENIIDNGGQTNMVSSKGSILDLYKNGVKKLVKDGTKYYTPKDFKTITINNQINFNIELLDNKFYNSISKDENDYSLCFLINFRDEKLLFTGDLTNSEKGEEYLASTNNLSKVTYYRASNGATNTKDKAFVNSSWLLSKIQPEFSVIACPGNLNYSALNMFTYSIDFKYILQYSTYTYMQSYIENGKKKPLCGDLCFVITHTESADKKIKYSMTGTNSNQIVQETNYYQNIMKDKNKNR